MELIAKLEDSPRGAYTGCIGFISPGKEAAFSVAIRTVLLDLAKGVGEIGLGSGITSDSSPAAEYAECRAKGIFLTARMPDFQLIETLLHTADDGLFLLDRHLARLAASAAYFGFRCDQHEIRQLLAAAAAKAARPAKMRLLLSRNGAVAIESESIKELLQPHTVRISSKRVNSGDPFLYHKTTYRPLYRAELQNHPECSDLLFCNERGEVTEAANCNIVARIDGKLLTPPVASGLLAGTFRDNLLESGTIVEQVLYPADLAAATELFLINSVRRWRKAVLASGNETEPSLK
jgi:para-aminobenzoate synthetase/4-amino-4-deoxychorismate lyase